MANGPIDPGVRIGHVHLKVADIERAPTRAWLADALRRVQAVA